MGGWEGGDVGGWVVARAGLCCWLQGGGAGEAWAACTGTAPPCSTTSHLLTTNLPARLLPRRRCDVDIRKDLYGGIVLTGGTAGDDPLGWQVEGDVACCMLHVRQAQVVGRQAGA